MSDTISGERLIDLLETAEWALLEMRDRFDLSRGDSLALDALEDEILSATNTDERGTE